MPISAIALLLRASTGHLLVIPTRHPEPAGWDLPMLTVPADLPLAAAQRQLCQTYKLELPLEVHGTQLLTAASSGQPGQVQLLRASTPTENPLTDEHRWIAPEQIAEFALGPVLTQLCGQGGL